LIETTSPCETVNDPATKFALNFGVGGTPLFSRSE
jgi:hypothetical protein